ncbi:MAG: hypothetical protein IT365_09840 [Candidatus Hydrogenedentes bacterium]|nr:hypothetical protein [Candidatus Hydrogenedentota bacterium]
MISQDDNPVAWALLLYELDEAREHLGKLIDELSRAGSIEDSTFAVDLGHIYAHLNRVWHARDQSHEMSEEQRHKFSQFPTDLDPVG